MRKRLILLLSLMILSGAALIATNPPDEIALLPGEGGEEVSYALEGSEDGATAQHHERGPSNCKQRSHDPHGSHHEDGRMSGEVRVTCDDRVPRMIHTSQLWEHLFWIVYRKIGVPDTFDKSRVRRGSANGNDICKKITVRTTGSGRVKDTDGRWYTATSMSRDRYNPCNLR